MVAAIENWSLLVGHVRHIANHDSGSDFTTVALDVEQVDDVDGFPNLLADANHTTVHIAVRDDRLRRLALEPGDRIRCRTRRARGNRLFAHPDSPELVTE
jgi:hypothetical protein